tara:strand:+ start:311 stop:556 length:246 start_codon:yes stop_codon:yes gene_type:complete
MPKILKPITILKTIGEVPEVTKDFLEQQVLFLKQKIESNDREISELQFKNDRLESINKVKNIFIKEYQEVIKGYKNIILPK